MKQKRNKQSKKQKGITLVALIITIVVLLLLAVVTIQVITGDGIVAHATEAKQKYSEAAVREKMELMLLNWRLETGSSKNLIEYLTEKKSKKEIEDYKENSDNTITIRLDNYDIIINQNDNSITNLVYNNKKMKKNRIIGEIYTTDISGDNASIKVISYTDNMEKEIKYTTVISREEQFSEFNVSYIQGEYRWHVKSDLIYWGYSTTNTIDSMQYALSKDISWGYNQSIHYYIFYPEENIFNITYKMNGAIAEVPDYYNTDFETELPILRKHMYVFTGWTGSNGSIPQKTIKIPKNSKGDMHFVANFEKGQFIAEIYTTDISGNKASIKVDGDENYNETEIDFITASNTSQEFPDFSITYGSRNWKITAKSDNVYYSDSHNKPIAEWNKLNTLSWHYTDLVQYYIIIK